MTVPKGPRGSARPMSIRDLARKLAREQQIVGGNTADENDDDFHDEVHAPPRTHHRAVSLREGASRMMASDLGVDPDLAAKAGAAAAKVLGALGDASSAEDSAEKARCINRAQKHLRTIDPAKHGALVQQLQARLLAAQGRGGDTEMAHVTPGELVIPPDLQTPEILSLLQEIATAQGIDISRLFVGSGDNSVNPQTGTREFWGNQSYDSNIETFTVTAPSPSFSPFAFNDPWFGYTISDAGSDAVGGPDPGIPTFTFEYDANSSSSSSNPIKAYRQGNSIVYEFADGRTEIRSDGTLSWRANNPGNLQVGRFTGRHGQIGAFGGTAIFPTEDIGHQARGALLRGPTYQPLTLDQAIEYYAPPKENPTAAYQSFIRNHVGVSGDTIIRDLTPTQMDTLLEGIRIFEGNKTGTITYGRVGE